MAVKVLTLLGAVQFANGAGTGAFPMSEFNGIPRTTRLVARFTYTEIVTAPITTNIWFFATRPVVAPPRFFLLGRGQFEHGLLDPVNGNAYLKLCFDAIPREPPPAGAVNPLDRGKFWALHAISSGKVNDGTITLDLDTVPSPDTSGSDSP